MSKNNALHLLLGFALSTLLAFNFFYDPPACAIAVNKLNVFYVGVDNPVSIVVRGVPKEQVVVKGDGLNLSKNTKEGDDYTVTATTPGTGYITVSGGDMKPVKFQYRVKTIPDPMPRLGGKHRGGTMGNGEFKAQNGISAVMENFDFDAYCDVVYYEVTYLAKNQDPVTVSNNGSRFNDQVASYVNRAKPGDVYFFDEIKVNCPGDTGGRNLGSLVFKIK